MSWIIEGTGTLNFVDAGWVLKRLLYLALSVCCIAIARCGLADFSAVIAGCYPHL